MTIRANFARSPTCFDLGGSGICGPTGFGGRSNAIRAALRSLAQDVDRNESLGVFLAEWESEAGPVNPAAVEAIARRYKL